MTSRLPLPEVTAALTLADPREPEHARLTSLAALMAGALAHPVASARWRALRGEIEAELSRRAALEGRSRDAVLHDEIAAAIVLASESARLVALRCFVESFSRELRLRTADELLTALCGHHRADRAQFESLDSVRALAAPDDTVRVDLEHLLTRVPALAGLTDTETAALRREMSGEGHTVASRKAKSRAMAKVRAIENI